MCMRVSLCVRERVSMCVWIEGRIEDLTHTSESDRS